MKIYDEMSEYYDLIYGDMTDADFYLREAANARGSVLEIGCGTGRIMLKLLEAGIDIAGIDASEKMLDILREKAEKKGLNPDVYRSDMLDFSLDKKFRLIILPYRTFLHLKNAEERKKALLNFKKHLEKGGRLILHLYNPSEDDLQMTGEFHHFETEKLLSSDGTAYNLDWHLFYEPSKRLAYYKIILSLSNGKSIEYNMEIHFTPMKEIGELLRETGYSNVRSYCGFDYSPYHEDCREVLWIAEN